MADINVIVLPDGTEYPVSDYYLPVNISNPTAGQVLKYDATNQVWYNGDDAEGSSVFYGTSAPTSQIGVDGNLYVKYTEGTGGASDTVDALYVKLDGAWCQISTGGGGGTSDYNDLTNKPQINSVELSGNKSLDDLGIQPSEISKTASGSIASFDNGGDDIPVSEFECEIVAVETGSGQKSPSNPYTITGFSQADIIGCGKNLAFDYIDNCNIDASGTLIWNTSYKMYIAKVEQGETYSINLDSLIGGYFDTIPVLNDTSIDGARVVTTPTFIATHTGFIAFRANSTDTQVSLKEGIDTTYAPYTGTLYTVSFGQTIYGGRLIYANGQWSIEATFGYEDLGNLNWAYDSTNKRFVSPLANAKLNSDGYAYTNLNSKCSQYAIFFTNREYTYNEMVATIANENNIIWLYTINSQSYVNVKDTTYTDAPTFKTAMSGVQFVYEIETPIIIPITSSTRIKTISGDNNIYSNTGDCELKYFTNKADSIAELAEAVDTDFHIYSTDEQIVGKWIDGRTVYEKTLNVGAIASDTTFAHGITNLDWIIDYSLIGLYGGGNKYISPANGSSSSIGFVISYWDSTNITFTKGNLSSNFSNCYCTLRYTKSSS